LLDFTHSYHLSGFHKVSERSDHPNSEKVYVRLKTINSVNPRRIIDLYDLPYLNVVTLIPPDMRLHLTKHKIQALSPHVRSSRSELLGSANKLCTNSVPATAEITPYFVLSLGEADVRQLPYPYARSKRRSNLMEGG
jgi:hypothetical protein